MRYSKIILFILFITSQLLFAQAEILDSTFAGNGKVITNLGSSRDKGFGVAIHPDGKIIVAGQYFSNNYDFAVVRYNSDGNLDMDFGTDGKVITPVGPHFDHGQSVAVQSDEKIVVVGYSWNGNNEDFSVVRYNTDGTLDNNFSSNGKVLTDFGSSKDNGFDIAIQDDGKIIVAGFSDSGENEDFALVRYNSDGTLDNTFDGVGRVTTDFSSSKDRAESIAIQSDGKIIVAGYAKENGNTNFALVRYNDDGALDNSFGSGGKVTTDLGSSQDYSYDAVIQSDGKIILAGESNDALAAVRYNSDGTLDIEFGSGGIITTSPFSSLYEGGRSIAIHQDGKIIFAGKKRSTDNNNAIAIARYNSHGTLDTEFADEGIAIAGFEASHAVGESVLLQTDGKIVVAGYQQEGGDYNFAIVRFNKEAADPPPATPAPFDSLVYFKFNELEVLKKHKITSDDYINYELDEIWEDVSNTWLNYSQTTRSFDSNNNLIERLGEFWDEGEWKNWWRNKYTFDSNSKKKTWQYYTSISGGWQPGVKETYSYDTNGNLILKEAVVDFQNTWRDSLIYDSNNNLIIYFVKDWVNNQ